MIKMEEIAKGGGRTSVRAGRSAKHLSGGVLHIAAVIGCINIISKVDGPRERYIQ